MMSMRIIKYLIKKKKTLDEMMYFVTVLSSNLLSKSIPIFFLGHKSDLNKEPELSHSHMGHGTRTSWDGGRRWY